MKTNRALKTISTISAILCAGQASATQDFIRSLESSKRTIVGAPRKTTARTTSQKPCSDFFASTSVRGLVNDLSNLARMDYQAWDEYRPESHPYLLTGEGEESHCALLVQQGTITGKWELQTSVPIANSLYSFFGKFSKDSFPKELVDRFETDGVDAAVILRVDPNFLKKAFPNTPDYAFVMSYNNNFLLSVLIHEGFHLFGQGYFQAGNSSRRWPEWDKQPERDEVKKVCYSGSDEKVRALFQRERTALLSAFKLASLFGKKNLALQAAKNFIVYRKQRYELLGNAKVPSQHAPSGISCPEAESIMELEEGGATYVHNATLLASKTIGLMNLREQMPATDAIEGDDFYTFGNYQLLLMTSLDDQGQSARTQRIAVSTRWQDGIFGEFERAINKLASSDKF
jgi:hypothetical protein